MEKAWDNEKVSGFIIVWETSFPYDNKRSARMRTRRKGRWLPRQPRLGARMCQGTFFFIIQKRRNRLKSACAFVPHS